MRKREKLSYIKEWKIKNPDKVREQKNRYNRRHRVVVRIKNLARYHKNRKAILGKRSKLRRERKLELLKGAGKNNRHYFTVDIKRIPGISASMVAYLRNTGKIQFGRLGSRYFYPVNFDKRKIKGRNQ